jgi:signal transduction histidine kinase
MIFSSLRIRLLLTMAVVVTVAVGTVAFFASRATTSEFRRSVQGILSIPNYSIETRIHAINKLLAQKSGDRDLWEDMQYLLEGMARTSRARFVLADLQGNVLADSLGELIGAQIDPKSSRPFAAFLIERKPVLAYLVPLEETGVEEVEARFITSVNRSLWVAIVSAGLVALALTLLLSRSLLGPISALTSAAQAMEKGDLSQRVAVKSGGEIGDLAQAFNAMADGLDRLEQLRRNMVTDVAHELRTPLSNVRGYLEAISDGVIQPSPENIASLHEEVMLLNRLVDDLQELALAEAGQINLVRQPVQVQEVVERAVQLIDPKAREKGLAVSVCLAEDLPPVDADARRFGQILRNLLNNALTNTPAGGEIRVSAKVNEGQVEVSVQDTGTGIAPEHLPFIFERFYRADRSRTRATGGAGLGLAIVKQLVEAQGGQVRIDSQVGKGTSVTFTALVAGEGRAYTVHPLPSPPAAQSIHH